MSYATLTESTTAFAEDIMQNFLHCSQGDFLPLGGASLQPTNAGTHLGNGTNYWSSLFCKTLDYNDIALTNTSHKFWTKVAEINLTATSSTLTFVFTNGADMTSSGVTIGGEMLIISNLFVHRIDTSYYVNELDIIGRNFSTIFIQRGTTITVFTSSTVTDYLIMGYFGLPTAGTMINIQSRVLLRTRGSDSYNMAVFDCVWSWPASDSSSYPVGNVEGWGIFTKTTTTVATTTSLYMVGRINHYANPGSTIEVWAR